MKKIVFVYTAFFYELKKKMQYKQQQYSPNFEKRILHFLNLIRNTVMNMIYE